MSAHLVPIPAAQLARFWHYVRPMLRSAAHRSSGKYLVEDILRDIRRHENQVWGCAVDGLVVATGLTQIVNFPRKRICRIIAVEGRDHAAWLDLIDVLAVWAKAEGCAALEPVCRPGWEKPLRTKGFRKTHILLERQL